VRFALKQKKFHKVYSITTARPDVMNWNMKTHLSSIETFYTYMSILDTKFNLNTFRTLARRKQSISKIVDLYFCDDGLLI
jgi:hypothetical protein